MALTFPRPMPEGFAAEQYFEPERTDFLSPETGGRLGGVQAGFPVWAGRWTFGQSISRDLSDQMRAFVATLRGQQRTFYAWDHSRPLPKKYPNGFGGMTRAGGGAFAGAATSWSVNGTRDALTADGLPAGLELSIGDYGMCRWATGGQQRRELIRFVEAGAASAGGVMTALTFEPPLPTLVPAGAVFDLLKPVCIMKAVAEETKIGSMRRTQKVDGVLVGRQERLP